MESQKWTLDYPVRCKVDKVLRVQNPESGQLETLISWKPVLVTLPPNCILDETKPPEMEAKVQLPIREEGKKQMAMGLDKKGVVRFPRIKPPPITFENCDVDRTGVRYMPEVKIAEFCSPDSSEDDDQDQEKYVNKPPPRGHTEMEGTDRARQKRQRSSSSSFEEGTI